MKRSLSTLALLGLLGAGCNGSPDVADPPASGAPVTQNGIEYTADTRVMESFPVQLDTRVTMRNRGAQRGVPEQSSGLRREEVGLAERRKLGFEFVPAGPRPDVDVLPIVETGALDLALIEREA